MKRILSLLMASLVAFNFTACGLTLNPKDFKDAPSAADASVQAIEGACFEYMETKETKKYSAFSTMKDGAWASAFSDMKEMVIALHLGKAQEICKSPTNIYDYAIKHDEGLFHALNNAMGHITDLGKTTVLGWLGSKVVKGFERIAGNAGTHNNFQATGDGNKFGSTVTDTKTQTDVNSTVSGENTSAAINPAGTVGPNQQQTNTNQTGVVPEGSSLAGQTPPAAEAVPGHRGLPVIER